MITSLVKINHLPFKWLMYVDGKFSLLLVVCLLITLTSQARPLLSAPRVNDGAIAQNPERLEPAKPVERTLNGGETHSYELKLISGQLVRLVADERGIDVTLTLFDADGKKLTDVNNKTTERGSESASLITEVAGHYRLEVSSLDRNAPPGRYEVRIDRVGPVIEHDRTLVAAERTVAEASNLLAQGTKGSVPQARAKYEAALSVFDLAGDLQMKALILNRIGSCFYSLSEYQKALHYHNQALPVTRAANDRQEEAWTLTNLGRTYGLMAENPKALDPLNQSLQIWQFIQDRRGELEALNIIARVYYGMGEVHKSLLCFDQALDLSRVLSDQGGEMMTLSGMAMAYYIFLPPQGKIIIPGPENRLIEKTVEGMYLLLLRIESAIDGLNQSNLASVNAGAGVVNSGGVSGFALPTLRYYVGTGGVAQIDEFNAPDNLLAPADQAEFTATQAVLFRWPAVAQVKYYRLTIESEAGAEVFSAVLLPGTRSYHSPSWLFKEPRPLLRWHVLAFGDNGVILSQTATRTLRRAPE